MKKIIISILAIMLVLSMAATALAVTPKLKIPSIQIPRIKTVEFRLPSGFWDNWFAAHPFRFGGA